MHAITPLARFYRCLLVVLSVATALGPTALATKVSAAQSIQISPSNPTVQSGLVPIQFSAFGGRPPYVWSISDGFAGRINSASGYYESQMHMASATIQVTDSLGNTGQTCVTVTSTYLGASGPFASGGVQISVSDGTAERGPDGNWRISAPVGRHVMTITNATDTDMHGVYGVSFVHYFGDVSFLFFNHPDFGSLTYNPSIAAGGSVNVLIERFDGHNPPCPPSDTIPPTLSNPQITTSPPTNPVRLPSTGGTVTVSVQATDTDSGVASATATVIGPNGSEPTINLTLSGGNAQNGTWTGTFTAPANTGNTPVEYQVIFNATDIANNQSAPSEAVTFTVDPLFAIEADARVYHINTVPAMPTVHARLRGGPANVQVSWRARIEFDPSNYPHGPSRSDLNIETPETVLPISQEYNPQFSAIRGGALTITATIVGNASLNCSTTGLEIIGDNPSVTEIEAALPSQYRGVLSLIARHESSWQQFLNGYPYWSRDDLGGVGLFQITRITERGRDRGPNASEVWNWRLNLQAAVNKFSAVTDIAGRYWKAINKSRAFSSLKQGFNVARRGQRLKPITITLRRFTKGNFNGDYQQHEMMAVRAYNGAAGTDPVFNLPLQEFVLATSTSTTPPGGTVLRVQVDERRRRGEAFWERVPPTGRPRVGDPDYVRHVLGL